MLIHGMISIQDLKKCKPFPLRPLKSCLLTKKISETYYISVKNSKYPDCINYNIAHISHIFSKFHESGKISIQFKEPRHLVSVKCDDGKMITMLLQQIRDIVSGKKVILAHREMPKSVAVNKNFVNTFSPECLEFTAIDRFDLRILNMKHLSKLVLENCVLPTLPVHIGQLPIKYISLSNSKLGSSLYDRDTLWDWMTENRICNTLNTLIMDSIGLQTLPFEIMFLENLKTLSVNKNKLTFLPQYLGKLNRLFRLYVADNALNYFPDSLYGKTFNELDISNNPFTVSESLSFDHICAQAMLLHNQDNCRTANQHVPKSLTNLSFHSLMDNCIKFKRQDIPRSLWHYFNVIGRCIHCFMYILPEYSVVRHVIGFPSSKCLTKTHTTDNLEWQSLICRYKCDAVQRKIIIL